jgi:membrane fusion protein (multidrug efflux system)
MAQAPEKTHVRQGDQHAVAQEYQVRRPYKKHALIGAGSLILLAALIWGVNMLLFNLSHQQTDDAYVDGHTHQVSTRIAGTVTRVLVEDNQFVRKGQVLVQLDPRDLIVQVQQAQAALALAERQSAVSQVNIPVAAAQANAGAQQALGNVAGSQAAISAAQANVAQNNAVVMQARAQLAQANANLTQAANDFRRYEVLERQGAISRQQYDQAVAALRVAQATRDAAADNVRAAQSRVTAAQQQVSQARAQAAATRGSLAGAQAQRIQVETARRQFETTKANIAQAQAQLNAARLTLSYTNVVAPSDGIVGNRNVEVGMRLQPGQALLAVVEEKPWVSANFKETQLENIRPGQPVQIHIDAFPHRAFYGKVQSISPASGAQFALLPPENATGNFTKIVQRVPVKVVFDPKSLKGFEGLIRPGMSAVVSVRTR